MTAPSDGTPPEEGMSRETALGIVFNNAAWTSLLGEPEEGEGITSSYTPEELAEAKRIVSGE